MKKILIVFCLLGMSLYASDAPSPYEAGLRTANNLSKAFRSAQDENTIKRILGKVNSSKNPEDFQWAIAEVLTQVSPERQGPVLDYLQIRYDQLKKR